MSENKFIEWKGGACPVDTHDRVEVKRRNGMKIKGFGKSFYWNHAGWPGDVLAYRILPPPKRKEEHV
jgi:hypothetical protein